MEAKGDMLPKDDDAMYNPHGSSRPSVAAVLSKSLQKLTHTPGLMHHSGRSRQSTRKMSTADVSGMREAHTLPNLEDWPHRPLLVCSNTTVCPDLAPEYGEGHVPLGRPFEFASDLFEGKCLIRLRGSNSDDVDGDARYFSGRKRIFQSVVQGRFRENVPVGEVLTGHEFSRPLKNLPNAFILKAASNFIRRITPGANIEIHSDQPYVEATLGGNSQIVRVDDPGDEPDITDVDLSEDCSAFGGAFARGNVPSSKRKQLFADPSKCEEYAFEKGKVYTFEFYQNLLDCQSYSLDLGITKLGVHSVLDGQPIQWLGKMKDGRYLWSFQIWHEKLLGTSVRPEPRRMSSIAKIKHGLFGR